MLHLLALLQAAAVPESAGSPGGRKKIVPRYPFTPSARIPEISITTSDTRAIAPVTAMFAVGVALQGSSPSRLQVSRKKKTVNR